MALMTHLQHRGLVFNIYVVYLILELKTSGCLKEHLYSKRDQLYTSNLPTLKITF